ncbi:cell growth-regulating nucleolar protein isoform X2 [Denticeps clupeoides]|uniref:cell growth-regulating nucleolar protein isoform X2 n=1 Tax=Denticeps clupeoides TaxID=299321 RepID=UPI0010A53EA1|nr:cell growth-regulating nucleolar protein isoform X2 [Denticeps clupeoides]
MVFFTCNACGESLKKAQVDKHVARCGGCRVLSCIDCGVDFRGNDYRNHVTCISEDQKYGGKGYEAKVNKGQVKQQQWIQKIQEAMSKPGISQKLKDVLSQVSSYDNVPRKKAKFQNWMKNSLKIHGPALHDEVWNIFSAATSDAPQESGSEQRSEPEASGTAENGEEEGAKEKKKNKRERKEERQKKHKRQRVPENGAAGDNGQAQADSGPSEKAKKKKRRKMEEEEVEDHRAQKKSKKENLENEIHEDADETQEEQEGDGAAKGTSCSYTCSYYTGLAWPSGGSVAVSQPMTGLLRFFESRSEEMSIPSQ